MLTLKLKETKTVAFALRSLQRKRGWGGGIASLGLAVYAPAMPLSSHDRVENRYSPLLLTLTFFSDCFDTVLVTKGMHHLHLSATFPLSSSLSPSPFPNVVCAHAHLSL